MKRKLLGLPERATHWHPCCQEIPEGMISNGGQISSGPAWEPEYDREFKTYRCPRGHEYEAPEPFILTTPDLGCNSGPVCVYCYVTWLHINLGTEE